MSVAYCMPVAPVCLNISLLSHLTELHHIQSHHQITRLTIFVITIQLTSFPLSHLQLCMVLVALAYCARKMFGYVNSSNMRHNSEFHLEHTQTTLNSIG